VHCVLSSSCLAQGVQNLTAMQVQGNRELGHNGPTLSKHRKVCVMDSMVHQQQSHGNDTSGSSTPSCSNSREEDARSSSPRGASGSASSPSNQVQSVVTSVLLSNRDSATRQQQLASFLSSLGLTSAVTIPAVPYICNSHNSYLHEIPGQAPQQAAVRNLDCVRSSTPASQSVSSSVRPLQSVRDGPGSSASHRMSQTRHCSISPRVQQNIVQNLSLIFRSRLEANNSHTTDDGSNGRERN
jgi:hypothetical protein